MDQWQQIKNSDFIQSLIKQLSNKKVKTIALPETKDPRVLKAIVTLLDEDLMDKIWVDGNKTSFLFHLKKHGLKISDSNLEKIIWGENSRELLESSLQEHLKKMAAAKKKTLDLDALQKEKLCPIHLAGMALKKGLVQGVLAGADTSTAQVIRAALNTIGLKPEIKTLSSSFIFIKPDNKRDKFIFGDCGVVIEPSSLQLVDIAKATSSTWENLTEETPFISFLSFSTNGSANHPNSQKIKIAVSEFKDKYPEIIADGEMQFDCAYLKPVGDKKYPDSKTSGKTNCYIFPNLDAGNIAYKITERLANYQAYGPILQGTAKGFCDLSRGAKYEDIVVMAIITLLI